MSNVKKHPWQKYIGYEKLTSTTKEGLDAAISYKLANGHVLVSRGIQYKDKEVHWASVKNTKHKSKRKAVRR